MRLSTFKPALGLSNPHLQIVWSTFCRRAIKGFPLVRERVELPDGDFVDLDWTSSLGQGFKDSLPIVLILHGLEGSILSSYAKGMLQAIQNSGWHGVFMHFRSCSGECNRLPRFYHSGDTHDVDYVVRMIHERSPYSPMAAIGFSLGGNVLLKWLGETAEMNLLRAAVAISTPFDLYKSVMRISKGFSRFYQWHLLNCLRHKVRRKFQSASAPCSWNEFSQIQSLIEFDNKITAPLHGFSDAMDYYKKSSCRQYLKKIRVPTLLLQAQDDPFMTADLLPLPEELSSSVHLELSEKGGHVGFIGGNMWSPHYWLEERVPFFLSETFSLSCG